ncbi:hypothetical protein ACKUT9_06510 [Mycobacterium seoulense]
MEGAVGEFDPAADGAGLVAVLVGAIALARLAQGVHSGAVGRR